jgi:hypothetical protein
MSHFSSLRTCITDLNMLAEACKTANVPYKVGQSLFARGYSESVMPCAFLIEGNRYDIGFNLEDGEYVASADFADAHGTGSERQSLTDLLSRAITQYNVINVQQQARQGALSQANVMVTVH